MSDQKAIFGTVTEVIENREIRQIRDEEGTVVDLEPGELKTRLKVVLKNTMNQTLEIWVDAPKEANDFFAPDQGLPIVSLASQLAASLAGEKDYHDRAFEALTK